MLRYLNARLLYPIAERYQGRDIRAKAEVLRQQMRWPWAERRAWAQAQLAMQLERAGEDVPYYRDLFRQIRFDPQSVRRDIDYLQDVPYLTKQILREQGRRMISERVPSGQLHERKTGGSTGPSTLIYYSQEALDWTAAVNLVCLEWAGKRRHMKELHLASRFPETFAWKDRLKERLKCLVLNRTNIFTDNFDPQGLEDVWRQLCRQRPHLIQGHPSTLYALAVHLRDQDVDARGVIKIFESTGEVLDPKKREAIETVFGCRAIDRFGNAEFGVLAYERLQDAYQRLKFFDGVAWPEQLPHEHGASELVITGLRNDAMPLFRYCTGDLAELQSDADGFYLRNIVGRVHDVVRIGEHRYPTHYLQDLLDRIGGIDEFQVEQRAGSSLLRLVVPDVEHRTAVSNRIEQWWGDAVELEFTNFDGLARGGWRSKFRYLVDSPASGVMDRCQNAV
jgi:phenylacetate-CoA ligase